MPSSNANADTFSHNILRLTRTGAGMRYEGSNLLKPLNNTFLWFEFYFGQEYIEINYETQGKGRS
jgi:hypothetical protein